MNFLARIAFCSLWIIFSIIPSVFAYSDEDITLRVGLSAFCGLSKTLQITSESKFTITDSNKSHAFSKGENLLVKLSKGKISARNNDIAFPIIDNQIIISSDGFVSVALDKQKPRKYRGIIEITAVDGKIRVVNLVSLEKYLLSVVPSEMPSTYPIEALKTQAITARTYAACIKTRHKSDGFDICDNQHCQMYLGAASEKENCTNAIIQTCGQIISYNKTIASVLYSADCGGVTANYSEIYPGSSFPYLCGVTDPADIPRKEWKYTSSYADISKKLISAGVKLNAPIQNISIENAGSNGRILSVNVKTNDSNISVTASKLRAALGSTSVLSTLFTLQSSDGKLTISGKGFGHGIGLCQTGTKALAQTPYNYDYQKIISHYFPGTSIIPISEANLKGKMIVAKKPAENKIKIEVTNISSGLVDVTVIPDAAF